MSAADLAEALRRRAAENPKLGYTVKFLLDDGDVIFWDGTGDQPVIGDTGTDEPADTTLRLSTENLQKLLDGNLDPTLAYMTGKLKVEGKLGVALKINSMLSD
jgi:putative sterol carrier protein